MIMSLFRKDPNSELAQSIYNQIVDQARNPWFYDDCGAPDSVEGRFELLTIHVYLVLQRLKGQNKAANALSQKVFDVFFKNMDDSLREMGVGDLSVGKKIRAMAEAFYGRVGVYEAGLQNQSIIPLEDAVARNVFEAKEPEGALSIAHYIKDSWMALKSAPIEELMIGKISFINITENYEPANDRQ